MSSAAGIPADAMAFYADLEIHNDRAWWAANKDRYETSVREPFSALVDALVDEFGEARIFRPYRDVRFSPDKTPYKTEQGAILGGAADTGSGVSGYYLRVGREGLTTGGGFMHAAADQVARYREAVADERTGAELQEIVNGLRRKRFDVGGEVLKTRPKGYDAGHPRVELLKHKSVIVWRDHGTPAWLHTSAAVRHVRDSWRAIGDLNAWVDAHVGPSTAPAPANAAASASAKGRLSR